jgi:hypothetical protein
LVAAIEDVAVWRAPGTVTFRRHTFSPNEIEIALDGWEQVADHLWDRLQLTPLAFGYTYKDHDRVRIHPAGSAPAQPIVSTGSSAGVGPRARAATFTQADVVVPNQRAFVDLVANGSSSTTFAVVDGIVVLGREAFDAQSAVRLLGDRPMRKGTVRFTRNRLSENKITVEGDSYADQTLVKEHLRQLVNTEVGTGRYLYPHRDRTRVKIVGSNE